MAGDAVKDRSRGAVAAVLDATLPVLSFALHVLEHPGEFEGRQVHALLERPDTADLSRLPIELAPCPEAGTYASAEEYVQAIYSLCHRLREEHGRIDLYVDDLYSGPAVIAAGDALGSLRIFSEGSATRTLLSSRLGDDADGSAYKADLARWRGMIAGRQVQLDGGEIFFPVAFELIDDLEAYVAGKDAFLSALGDTPLARHLSADRRLVDLDLSERLARVLADAGRRRTLLDAFGVGPGLEAELTGAAGRAMAVLGPGPRLEADEEPYLRALAAYDAGRSILFYKPHPAVPADAGRAALAESLGMRLLPASVPIELLSAVCGGITVSGFFSSAFMNLPADVGLVFGRSRSQLESLPELADARGLIAIFKTAEERKRIMLVDLLKRREGDAGRMALWGLADELVWIG